MSERARHDQPLKTGGALACIAAVPAAVLVVSALALIWTPAVWLLAGGVAAIYGALTLATGDRQGLRCTEYHPSRSGSSEVMSGSADAGTGPIRLSWLSRRHEPPRTRSHAPRSREA